MSELFIVGAQRSGTTYLYEILAAHPQVCMAQPVRPEPKHFFDKKEYCEGKEYYEAKYFKRRLKEHKYIGEKSTSYIESTIAASRIQTFYPDAKILIILRDPVERAFSNYRFSVENGIEPLSFRDALIAEKGRLKTAEFNTSVNPYAYRQRGLYLDYIQNFTKSFNRSQIKVLIHEEFIANAKAISGLYAWLEIEEEFMPDEFRRKVNDGRFSPSNTFELQECKRELFESYGDSIEQLEEFLGRKINIWRN